MVLGLRTMLMLMLEVLGVLFLREIEVEIEMDIEVDLSWLKLQTERIG